MSLSIASATKYGRIFSERLKPLDRTKPALAKKTPFGILDLPAFLQTRHEMKWLIEGVLVQGQPGVIGGSQKSNKTTLAIEASVCLASGRPFLNKFKIPALRRVALMSAESGPATIKKTILRICDSKQILEPELLPIFIADVVPNLSDPKQLKKLHRILRELRIDVVIIDPLYLCLQSMKQASQVSNMFATGPLLAKLTQACLRAGATPLLVHHTRKAGRDGGAWSKFQRPELEDLAFAGVQQFVRQWILLGRRKAYDPETGKHELWLSYGGSAGHSGSWGLDINEGVADSQFGGRTWSVKVLSMSDLEVKQRKSKEDTKDRDRKELLNAAVAELLGALRKSQQPLTRRDLKDRMVKGAGQLAAAINQALDDRLIIEAKVTKPGGRGERAYDAYALANVEQSRTTPMPAAPATGPEELNDAR